MRSAPRAATVVVVIGLAALAACAPQGDRGVAPLPPPPSWMADDVARQLQHRPFLVSELDYYAPDPYVGHLHRPFVRRRMEWSEHAQGEIVLQTNNLGLREDEDCSPRGREGIVTILVTGDSHTDGVIWNRESFPNLVELELERRHPERRVEVLNGGVGHFGPHNYPRWVERFAFLDPAMVIVVVYLGNDFLDCAEVLEGTGLSNERGPDYYQRLNALPRRLRRTASQHLNQAYYLATFPHMQARVLDSTDAQLARLASWCGGHGVELVLVLLPDKITAERDGSSLRRAAKVLGLGVNDLAVGRRLTEELRSRLEARGITVMDLKAAMAGRQGLYWEYDHHLSSAGHRLVADVLLEAVAAQFDRLPGGGG